MKDLPDNVLQRIFSYLSPKDRFGLALVCRRCCQLVRPPWTDLRSLDITSIPSRMICSVMDRCPNATNLNFARQKLPLDAFNQRPPVPDRQLRTFKSYGCCFLIDAEAEIRHREREFPTYEECVEAVCARYPHTFTRYFARMSQLEELILYRCCTAHGFANDWDTVTLPASLKRLEFSTVGADTVIPTLPAGLECLKLGGRFRLGSNLMENVFGYLPNLRELYLSCTHNPVSLDSFASLACARLPQLQVFCFVSYGGFTQTGLSLLTTQHPSLRILLIAALSRRTPPPTNETKVLVPPRRFSPGILLPVLHVFVGGRIAQRIRFARSPSGLACFHPMDKPIPEFLQKPDVAELCRGVAVFKMIRDVSVIDERRPMHAGSYPIARDERFAHIELVQSINFVDSV